MTNGTVNISIKRFKELEEYESNWNEFKGKNYVYRKLYYSQGIVENKFITRKEFKDKLYEEMREAIDTLEKEVERIKNVPTFSPERIEHKKCWFCK
tara:strand:+ start:12767 stop:13054 length:288 start_codon:yes stop_codon:yes gene_type:complete